MIRENRLALSLILLTLLAGCANVNSKQQVLAAGSQVEVRSYQTRTYDTNNKILVMRAVMSTLQDLRFVIDKADDTVGVVSATKLDGYALSISVSVRPSGERMIVRANAQYNLKAIEEPGPYQDFFAALDKGLFLDNNLLDQTQVVTSQPPAAPADAVQADAAAVSVYAFYGEAEAEIDEGSQDRDLWARALVEVEGDEQKRKARYIELRAQQLYIQSPEALAKLNSTTIRTPITRGNAKGSSSTVTALPPGNLSGTYISEITTDIHWVFEKPSHRRLVLVLEQQGGDITAINESTRLKISGTLDDGSISFFTWPSDISLSEIKGTWQVVDGGSRLEGKWTHLHGGGKWNLTRLQ